MKILKLIKDKSAHLRLEHENGVYKDHLVKLHLQNRR